MANSLKVHDGRPSLWPLEPEGVMRIRWLAGGLLAVVLAGAHGSPSSGGHRNALIMQSLLGESRTSGVQAGVITEVDVPVVQSRRQPAARGAVRLADAPAGLHVLRTDAYYTPRLPVGIMSPTIEPSGTLSPGQPRFWGPRHPVTAITLPAHGRATWVAVIAFTAGPGTYRFTGIKITYAAGGRQYWQNEGLGDTIRYFSPTAGEQGQHARLTEPGVRCCSPVLSVMLYGKIAAQTGWTGGGGASQC